MSRKYKFRDNDKLYFVSFAVVEWIDLFIRNEYKDIIIKSLEYCIKNNGPPFLVQVCGDSLCALCTCACVHLFMLLIDKYLSTNFH